LKKHITTQMNQWNFRVQFPQLLEKLFGARNVPVDSKVEYKKPA